MRRPGATRKQKQHAREQRALLRLRRAAVRYTLASENAIDVDIALAFADLNAASDNYSTVISSKERKRLSR